MEVLDFNSRKIIISNMNISSLLTLGLLLVGLLSIKSQVNLPYNTGFENVSEKEGWVEYKTEATQFSHWGYGSGYLSSVGIGHDYSPASAVTLTDNWFVSPGFLVSSGGVLDSVRYKFSGFSEPLAGDTIGIYLLSGSQNPLLASSKLLLLDFRGTEYIADGMYRKKDNITLPAVNDTSYLAIRYRNTDCSSKWLTVSFDNLAINGNITGLEKKTNNPNRIKIYPNPTIDLVKIKITKEVSNLTMTNVDGKIIYYSKIEISDKDIDVSSFEKGVYFLRYEIDRVVYSDKVIVQ